MCGSMVPDQIVCGVYAAGTLSNDGCMSLARLPSPSQEVIAHRLKLLDPR